MKGEKINGKRILLNQVKISDAPILGDYFNKVYYLLGQVGTNTRIQTREYIRTQNSKENTYYWAIRLNDSCDLIGAISLDITDHGIAFTGTMLGEKYTSLGYGTEAKHLVLEHAFCKLGIKKIFSSVFSYNPKSKSYSIKCGYIHEATITNKKYYNGKYWNEWILSITKEQWLPVWKKRN